MEQLRQVRGTIPRLFEPLLQPYASPQELYSKYSQNALETGKEIRALTDLIEDSQYQDLLQKVKDGAAAEPDGITPWMVTEHADWLERRELIADGDMSDHRKPPDGEEAVDRVGEDPSNVVNLFRTDHPDIDVRFRDGDSKTIEVWFLDHEQR